MVHVLCKQKGAGKTKVLVEAANEKALKNKGHIVYIDDDDHLLFQLDRRIRFINTTPYKLSGYSGLLGFICGIISKDYDVNYIFLDGLFNIVSRNEEGITNFFFRLEKLSVENNINFYVNISSENEKLSSFVKKYSCELLKV